MRILKMIFVRRVVGGSMKPKLVSGQLLLATALFRRLRPGQVVIIEHQGKQKVKRIERVNHGRIFVIGDNLKASTDSRHFGWLNSNQVIARVVWPNLSK